MTNDTSAKQVTDFLTLEESAEFAGVSERTIQRHALLSKQNPTSTTIRKGKKVKGYRKDWLTDTFKNDSQSGDTQNDNNNKSFESDTTSRDNSKQSTENQTNKSHDNDEIVVILKEEVNFLRTEIGVKNEQISKLQESEKNTKMLLADLQIQNKALQLPEAKKETPTAKPLGKKSRKIWIFVSVVLFIAIAASAYAYNYYYGFKNLNWW